MEDMVEKLLLNDNIETIVCSIKTQSDIFKKYGIIKKVLQSPDIKDDNVFLIKFTNN